MAARIREYQDVGVDTFIMSGYPHLEEAYRFAELVFPLLSLQQHDNVTPLRAHNGPSMQRLLGRVWQDQTFTAILVTHDVAEAVALADRVLVIEDGRIAHDVTVDLARPRQRGSAELARLEGDILKTLLSGVDDTSDL